MDLANKQRQTPLYRAARHGYLPPPPDTFKLSPTTQPSLTLQSLPSSQSSPTLQSSQNMSYKLSHLIPPSSPLSLYPLDIYPWSNIFAITLLIPISWTKMVIVHFIVPSQSHISMWYVDTTTLLPENLLLFLDVAVALLLIYRILLC